MNKIRGITKSKLLCCDSSEDCALADPRTIRLIEISDTDGETKSNVINQFIFGVTAVCAKIKITASIMINEKTDMAMLNKNEANIFALKISLSDNGL